MQTLSKKLLRDLWHLRSQVAAITLIIISGVGVFIMSYTTLQSLELTRKTYYQLQNFADIFVNLKRAPLAVLDRIRKIEGVKYVDPGIVANVNVQISGFNDPIQGRLASYDDRKSFRLNQPYLTKGRLLRHNNKNEIMVSDTFFKVHQLKLNDSINITINGKNKDFTIIGVALSPEYIYQVAPGGVFPDYMRFAVMWIDQKTFAEAYNMNGAFNKVDLTILPGANPKQIIKEVDHLLEPYGGLGAYERTGQLSYRILQSEFKPLRISVIIMPIIFFAVVSFLLNIFVIRLIQVEREQISILKAFGYSDLQVVIYYLKLVTTIVLLGLALGIIVGIFMGQALSQLYANNYKFPYLLYHVDLKAVILVIIICLSIALIGPLIATRKAFKLTPAQGMRPEAPANYRSSIIERIHLFRKVSYVIKMIFRNIERSPFKSIMILIGIACSGGILIVGLFQQDAIHKMIDTQFNLIQKEDMQISFYDPVSNKVIYSLKGIQGINFVEGQRTVPVRLNFENKSYLTFIQALSDKHQLRQLFNLNFIPTSIPDNGIVLSEYFQKIFGIDIGDKIEVEILEGKKTKKEVLVVGFTKEYLGLGAYMSFKYIYKLLQESEDLNGALLSIDKSKQRIIFEKLKEIPIISGITFKSHAISNFQQTFAKTILIYTLFITLFSAILCFGLVLNNAMISFAERYRELATLRVMGFTNIEVTFILLGEITLITLLAIPAGFIIGFLLSNILASNLQSDLYRIPLVLTKKTFTYSCLVILFSSLISSLILFNIITKINLAESLKIKE